MKKEVLVIVNECAGRGKNNKYISKICQNLEKQNYDVEVLYTSKEKNGEQIVKEYIRFVDTIIVCGGDGTLSEVINGIIKCNKKINVTYIPMGTTNDFAKTVKVPKNKYKLSKKLAKYNKHEIDIGKFKDSFFCYVAAFGAFSEVSYTTKQKDKNKFGRIAYFKEVFLCLRKMKKLQTIKTTLVTDNEIIKDEFIYGSISNSISIAGFKWFKRNDFKINDGLFEIILIKKPKNFLGILKIMKSILIKKYDQQIIYYLKSKHLKLDFEKEVSLTLDGEYGGNHKEILIEVNKNKIGFLCP